MACQSRQAIFGFRRGLPDDANLVRDGEAEAGTNDWKIGNYYLACMGTAALDRLGYRPLEPAVGGWLRSPWGRAPIHEQQDHHPVGEQGWSRAHARGLPPEHRPLDQTPNLRGESQPEGIAECYSRRSALSGSTLIALRTGTATATTALTTNTSTATATAGTSIAMPLT